MLPATCKIILRHDYKLRTWCSKHSTPPRAKLRISEKEVFLGPWKGTMRAAVAQLILFCTFTLNLSVPAEVLRRLDNRDFLRSLDIILSCRLALLQAEQTQFSQPLFTREMLQLSACLVLEPEEEKLEELQSRFFHDQLQCCTFPWPSSKFSAAESHIFHSCQCVIIQPKSI